MILFLQIFETLWIPNHLELGTGHFYTMFTTSHMSCDMCHESCVTCPFFSTGGACRWRVCYQRGLPRLYVWKGPWNVLDWLSVFPITIQILNFWGYLTLIKPTFSCFTLVEQFINEKKKTVKNMHIWLLFLFYQLPEETILAMGDTECLDPCG